jgi:hypothetical protein
MKFRGQERASREYLRRDGVLWRFWLRGTLQFSYSVAIDRHRHHVFGEPDDRTYRWNMGISGMERCKPEEEKDTGPGVLPSP